MMQGFIVAVLVAAAAVYLLWTARRTLRGKSGCCGEQSCRSQPDPSRRNEADRQVFVASNRLAEAARQKAEARRSGS